MAVQALPEELPASLSNASLLAIVLAERLARRGWHFREAGTSVTAHRSEWPTQLCVLVREAEEDAPAMLGLAIELGAMPLRGERFRDIFNSEREHLLRGYGRFNVLQMIRDGGWLRAQPDRAFLRGMSDGLSRKAQLAVFDRTSSATPTSLVDQFAADSNRLVEVGGEIAALLQRLYQRTVLSKPVAGVQLPDLVRPSIPTAARAADAESDTYPWRR